MGYELNLLPRCDRKSNKVSGEVFGTTVIPIDRPHGTAWYLWESIAKGRLESEHLADNMVVQVWDDDNGLREVEVDRFGEPIRLVRATEIVTALESCDMLQPVDLAAVAYFRELDPQTLVVFYWH